MIRTSIVLSPRQSAAERLYFQANGLPVDVTSASQSVVLTSHRPTQLYVANHSGQRQSAASLTAATGFQGQHMQRLMDILERQGSDALARLFSDGELAGAWLVAIDENRLNAVLSDRFQFFLYRGLRLREMRPVSRLNVPGQDLPGAPEAAGTAAAADAPGSASAASTAAAASAAATGAGAAASSAATGAGRLESAAPAAPAMSHYRIEIRQDDQVLVVPRGLIPAALLGEAEQVLQGMQQLPDRLSALVVRLRERGVTAPTNGWLAVQVLRTMTEYVATDRPSRPWLAARRKGGDSEGSLGFSEEVTATDGAGARGFAQGGRRTAGRSARGAGAPAAAAAGGAADAAPAGAAAGGSAAAGYGGGSGTGTARDSRSYGTPAPFSRGLVRLAVLAVFVLILAAAAYIVFRPQSKPPVSTTTVPTTLASSVTTTTTTARPTVTPVPTTVATTAPRVTGFVIARRLNVRSEPNSSSKLIRTLTVGQTLYILEQTNKDWTKIQTMEGETGYVYAAYISKDKPAG